jgi:hypothetical protein
LDAALGSPGILGDESVDSDVLAVLDEALRHPPMEFTHDFRIGDGS